MGLSNADVSRLVLALVLLLVSAHALGRLCTRLRQPKVAGEILGGLLLGPTRSSPERVRNAARTLLMDPNVCRALETTE